MDRKLLFYLLGSVEESHAKFALHDKVRNQLSSRIKADLEVVETKLDNLRRSVAEEYLDASLNENSSTTSDSPVGSICR